MPFAVKAILNLPIHEYNYNNTMADFMLETLKSIGVKTGRMKVDDNIEKNEFCEKKIY